MFQVIMNNVINVLDQQSVTKLIANQGAVHKFNCSSSTGNNWMMYYTGNTLVLSVRPV